MNMSNNAKPDCEDCGGEGIADYGGFRSESDGVKTLPCQKCYPNTSWSDFE